MRGGRGFRRDRAGSVGMIAALTMPVMIGFAALGTDYGFFLYDKQRLQDAVDLAALSAAAAVGREEETARRIVSENDPLPAEVEVLTGAADEGADGGTVFRAGAAGGAVRVRARRPTTPFFSRLYLRDAPVLDVSATAVAEPLVSFSIGTKLSVVSGGIPGALTESLLGSRVDLSILGHDGLLRSTVRASGLVARLADALDLTGATVGEVLDAKVPAEVLVRVAALSLREEGRLGEAAGLDRLAKDLVRAQARVSLGEILALPRDVREIAVGAPSSYLTADVAVAGLLTAALTPRGSGSGLAADLTLPGLASLDLRLLVGEPMVTRPLSAVARPGEGLATAQVRGRLRLGAQVPLGLVPAGLDVPLELAVAPGEARVVAAACGADPAARSVTIEVRAGAARLEIGDGPLRLEDIGVAPTGRAVEILRLPALAAKAHAVANARGLVPVRLTFAGREIGNGTVRQAGSRRMVSALVDDLFRSLALDVRVLGLGLGLGNAAATGIVETALDALSEPVDAVLDATLAMLGIKVGAIDVRVDDVVCGEPRIVL